MNVLRAATVSVLGLRIAYGAAMIATPERIGRPWLGASAERSPTQVPLRGIGGREIAVHAVALTGALQGTPVRPWLTASLAGDLADLAATFAGRKGLPNDAFRATLTAGGGSALVTIALLALVD